MTYQQIANRLLIAIDQLDHEAHYIYQNLVLPNWDSQPHRYWNTLYGLIMTTFATLDLVSHYWEGHRGDQTDRTRRFMDKYLSADTEANDVALQMWRHSLMHTAQPRILFDQRTQIRYRWLLHWSSDKLAPVKHFTFQHTGAEGILNLTLLNLIDEVRTGITKYTVDLAQDSKLQQRCIEAHARIELQSFRSRP